MQINSTPTSPQDITDDQIASTEDRNSQRERLIDDLAFLAVREHRRRKRSTAENDTEADDEQFEPK